MITSIWFDCGGVLTEGTWQYDPLCKKYSLNKESFKKKWAHLYQAKYKFGKISSREFVKQISGGKIPQKEFFAVYEKLLKPRKSMLQLVKKVSGKYILVYANNEAKGFDLAKNHKMKHFQYFDHLCSSWRVADAKPHQSYFKLILKRTKQKPVNCLFIDDQRKNILAAKKLGVHTIHFKNTQQVKREMKKYLA